MEQKALEFIYLVRNRTEDYLYNDTIYYFLGDDYAFNNSESTFNNFDYILKFISEN